MEYTLIRSRRKTLAIEITREAKLVVRAPLRCSKAQIERFLTEKQGWIESHLAKMEARNRAHPEPTAEEEAALRQQAKRVLPQLVEKWAAVMAVEPAGITSTGARTRFGSCSPKNRLCFSWRLMQYPEEAVDYVVVHELAHIRHHNHSPAFYGLVEQYMPDYRRRRALLRD